MTLGTGLSSRGTRAGAGSTTSRPTARSSRSPPTGPTAIDTNFDVFMVPADGGTAAEPDGRQPGGRRRPRLQPGRRCLAFGRQPIKGFYGDRARLMLHDRKAGTTAWSRTELGPRSAPAPSGRRTARRVFACDRRRGHLARDPRSTPRPAAPAVTTDSAASASHALSRRRPDARRAARELHRAADPRAGRPGDRRGHQALDVQRRAARERRLRHVRERDLQGRRRRRTSRCGSTTRRASTSRRSDPLYLLIHGGPHNGITDGFSFRWNAQVFSSWGYVTAWPNFHGSSGFGKAFTDSINPQLGDQPYEDVIKAADWFARSRGSTRTAWPRAAAATAATWRASPRPRAPVQNARLPTPASTTLHAVRGRLRRRQAAASASSGSRTKVFREDVAALRRGELQDADARGPRRAATTACPTTTGSSSTTCSRTRRSEPVPLLPGREPLGPEAAELRCSGTGRRGTG